MMNTPLDQSTPEGELLPGTTVYDVDGQKVGPVRLSALRDGYFVVEQGWLFTHELYLPTTAIAKRDAMWVGLNLSKEELRQSRWKTPPDEWLVSGPTRPFVPPSPPENRPVTNEGEDMPPPAQESEPPLSQS